MPVTAFGLKNFMAFGTTGFGVTGMIELRKINLLYGRNSNGKSVIIRALRLLKQSLSAGYAGEPLKFVVDNGVDVGSFKAVLHRSSQEQEIRFHNPNIKSWSRPISFSFRCEMPSFALKEKNENDWLTLGGLANIPSEKMLCFEASLSYSSNVEKVVCVGVDLWQVETLFGSKKRKRLLTLQYDPDLAPMWSGYSDIDLPSKSSGILGESFSVICSDGFLPVLGLKENHFSMIEDAAGFGSRKLNELLEIWGFCRKEIKAFLESILYVGPIRPLPERYYLIDQRAKTSFYWQGAQAFLDYLLNPSESEYLQRRIEKWMSTFELGESIRRNKDNEKDTTDRLVAIRELIILEGKDPSNDQTATNNRNMKDMGFGASQILPIIITCLTAPEDAFIIIEQPELHLHPEAQAETAGLFIECVDEISREESSKESKEAQKEQVRRRRETNVSLKNELEGSRTDLADLVTRRTEKRVGRRCLIETHSEHLLIMLQRNIAEGALHNLQMEKSEVKHNLEFYLQGANFRLFFVTRDKDVGKSSVEVIQVDHLGRLKSLPPKFRVFFERDYKDSKAFSVNVAEAIELEAEYEAGN